MLYPTVTIDLAAIDHAISQFALPTLLMVKADAYGLGVQKVVSATPHAVGYGVATVEEGVLVRSISDKPVLVTTPTVDAACRRYGLTPLVGSFDQVEALPQGTIVHLKINTGMNRFGVRPDQAKALALVCVRKGLVVKGIATHYLSPERAIEQNKSFILAVRQAEEVTGRLLRHAQASSTVLHGWYDMLRVGMAAYHGAVTVKSTILAVQTVRMGETVGYDGVYTMPRDGEVAVVAGGYADGFAKGLVGGMMWANGHLHKIVAVCMDVVMLHLSCPCKVGDEVVLADHEYSDYELFCGLGGRTRYVYQ